LPPNELSQHFSIQHQLVMPPNHDSERAPLLQDRGDSSNEEEIVKFEDGDEANPRNWPLHWKYIQTFQIFILAFVCPMASSAFAPAMSEVAKSFNTSKQIVVGGQTGFVCMLGIGPLFLAPMSETFGRRNLFLINLALFTLMQIPTALAPNIESFIVVRTLSGLFGSVGVANGGGSVADLFETKERAKVLGVYLVAPLLGPTIGPLIGGLVVGSTSWRWIFWISMILSGLVTTICYFFLYETNATTILQNRKQQLQKKNPETKYKVEGQSDQSTPRKIAQVSTFKVC
jgi:multidrug resistance protein